MRFWISHYKATLTSTRPADWRRLPSIFGNSRRSRRLANVALGSLLMLVLTGGGAVSFAETWETYPWVSLSAGYENDRILEQGTDRFIVPGGNFFDLMPGVLFSRGIGRRTRLNLDGQLILEKFNNDDGRSLVSTAVNAELRQRFGSVWRWRLTVGGNYFADSIQETTNRFHGGAEAAIGLTGRRGYFELLVGAQGRRYPNLLSFDDSGIPGTYTELGATVGVTGAYRPAGRLVVSGLASGQTTDARDPTFDATSILAQVAVRVAIAGSVWAYVSGFSQERSFAGRVSGEDTDSYRQLGIGIDVPLGRTVDLSGRIAFARYTDPLGDTDDIRRFSIGIAWWPSGRGVRTLPLVLPRVVDAGDDENEIVANEPHLFRLHAPGARAVALVTDFNGWDPETNPLRAAGDGWWEAKLALPAGSYQYAYWVDGVMVTPPEAEIKIDDGFGSKNGLLNVDPKRL